MSEPLIRRINREQMCWRAVDVEQLIEQDHVARTIWDLVGGLDLEGFCAGIGCSEEAGGRPAFNPQLLISLWIYAYSQGIGSAREVGRRCEWEPALQCRMGPLDASTFSCYRRHPLLRNGRRGGDSDSFLRRNLDSPSYNSATHARRCARHLSSRILALGSRLRHPRPH